MTHDEYLSHDATGLAELVRRGEVSALELLELALSRAEALDPSINAIVHSMEDDARRDASRDPSGPFCGVPFLAKDLVSDYADHPTSAGSRYLADRIVARDSELAARVRASGVSIFGKTNLPEWGLLPVTEPELWGPCRNPWNTERTPGGSSGGSAAAVAAGIVPMAGGSDGAGSIRIPASCCGLFGLKPTRGRTPTGPERGLLWRGATVEHVLTRSVRDSALMLDATHGPDPGAPYEIVRPERPFIEEVGADPGRLRVAWTTTPVGSAHVDPDCVAAVADAVALLEELGHEVVEAGPMIDGDAFARSLLTIVAGELSADLVELQGLLGRGPRRDELEPTTFALALVGTALTAEQMSSSLRHLERVGRDVGAFFTKHDILLTPTLARPPVRIGSMGPTRWERTQLKLLGLIGSGRRVRSAGLIDKAAEGALEFTPWTAISNATGQPAMSLPLFWSADDLPIGVHLSARFGREDTLLRLASQLERARPWFDRLAPLARSLSEPRSLPARAER